MDVAGGFVLFAALVAVLWLLVESVSADREDRRRSPRLQQMRRSTMFRRCQIYRSNIGHERAMRRAADYVDGRAP